MQGKSSQLKARCLYSSKEKAWKNSGLPGFQPWLLVQRYNQLSSQVNWELVIELLVRNYNIPEPKNEDEC